MGIGKAIAHVQLGKMHAGIEDCPSPTSSETVLPLTRPAVASILVDFLFSPDQTVRQAFRGLRKLWRAVGLGVVNGHVLVG